ncbi:lysis system i-spanin subunit Rz [Burkholderia stagnalis]|uniref:lysis system i-spanin subunit Rz n=1 Tax=Burkholderia stagnalis TaxID=1503054 RepID=UPI001E604D76|nr:lysis system i-spanin subunit Rz [Burkholderia stagnalis]MDY7806698.1 lysis system i-spanin subunit Rz [Burkholderia stagnalis]
METIGARRLAQEQAARARDNQQHTLEMKAVSDAALSAQQKAIAERDAAAQKVEALNTQRTKESEQHEDENRRLRAALASGTERVRVAVTHCSTRGNGVPKSTSAAGVDDGGAAVAELDSAVAQRAFGVAGADQHEIDKLTALQGYVCAIRPDTPACWKP